MYGDYFSEDRQEAFSGTSLPDDPASEMDADFQQWVNRQIDEADEEILRLIVSVMKKIPLREYLPHNPHPQRTSAEKAAHGQAMERENVLPASALDRMLMDIAMNEIHGCGIHECDTNGDA